MDKDRQATETTKRVLVLFLNKLGYTQRQFAEFICVTPQAISHYLSGRNKMPASQIELVKYKLPNINPDYIDYGYGFKHTGNSKLLSAGMSVSELMEQNGHQEERTTRRYAKKLYARANDTIRFNSPKF